jgi:Adenylate and Guanylate cyclase catalytic domain
MSAEVEQRKLAAIMFTDMVGYSGLAQRDERLALELLEEHRQLLRGIFPRFNGIESKTIGDGFLVEFSRALEAAHMGWAYARSGQKDNAIKTLEELNQLASERFVSPFCQALVYLGLREDDKTLDWLEKAYNEGSIWLGWLKMDPMFDPLRSNPRFQALYKKMNFPP